MNEMLNNDSDTAHADDRSARRETTLLSLIRKMACEEVLRIWRTLR
jgi:hypothetical protein